MRLFLTLDDGCTETEDYCGRCWPHHENLRCRFNVIAADDSDPDNHPDYGDTTYDCDGCGCKLTDQNG